MARWHDWTHHSTRVRSAATSPWARSCTIVPACVFALDAWQRRDTVRVLHGVPVKLTRRLIDLSLSGTDS